MLHSCLNYAENVTLIIGIYGVCAAFDMIDDNAGQNLKSTLRRAIVVSSQVRVSVCGSRTEIYAHLCMCVCVCAVCLCDTY